MAEQKKKEKPPTKRRNDEAEDDALGDRVEHHRIMKLGRHFTNDVDALGLELL